jgi:hypothetical protein
MCEACKATGLYRPCDMCSGYDWVEDIYEWADDARQHARPAAAPRPAPRGRPGG